jgi:glutamyl-tRNA reductase
MSGRMVRLALRTRFETIRQSELARLDKKLRGLSDDERESVKAITAEVVHAITRLPERVIDDSTPTRALDALVHLFALEPPRSEIFPEDL